VTGGHRLFLLTIDTKAITTRTQVQFKLLNDSMVVLKHLQGYVPA
jgi:hypothetical protein